LLGGKGKSENQRRDKGIESRKDSKGLQEKQFGGLF